MRRLVLLLLLVAFPNLLLADVDSLGASAMWDQRLDGRSGNETLNYGARTDIISGFNTSGSVIGRALIGLNLSTIRSGYPTHDIDSIRFYFNVDLNNSNPKLVLYRTHTQWIEGTQNALYQLGSSNWNVKGHGTAIDGTTIAQADSNWTAGGGTIGGNPTYVTGAPSVQTSGTGWHSITLNALATDSYNTADKNHLAFLLIDTAYVGGSVNEYVRWRSSEDTGTPATLPYFKVYHSTPAAASADIVSDLTLITLSGGTAGALTNYPVRLRLRIDSTLGWRAISQTPRFTIFDSDSSTKLYWCDNNSGADTLDIFVRIPATGNTDSLYFSQTAAPVYRNCDSVFLYYNNFDGSFQYSQAVSVLTDVERAARDTIPTNPFFTLLAGTADSVYQTMREHGNIYWSDHCNQYLHASSVHPYGTAYSSRTNTQLAWWTSTDGFTWEHQGRILLLNGADTLQMQDPYFFEWQDSLFIAFEDKRTSADNDEVGLIVSPDCGVTWFDRGIILDTTAFGTGNYESPSSPVVWVNGDTIWIWFEGKNGGGYDLGGNHYGNSRGVTYGAKGLSPYTLAPIYNPDTTAGEGWAPVIPYPDSPNACDAGMVPHGIAYNNGLYYITLACIDSTDLNTLDEVGVFSTTNLDSSWTYVSSISANDPIWISTGSATYDLDADGQVYYGQPATHGGQSSGRPLYYIGMSSNDQLFRTVLIRHSATGAPFDFTWHQTGSNAKGFAFTGLTQSVLSLEAEPLSARNAIGIVTAADSFTVNFLAEARLKFTAGTYTTDPYFVAGFGSGAVTNIGGSGGTSYEHSCLANGFGLQATGSAAWQPFVQPATAARSTSGFSTLADASYSTQHWLHWGMTTDTLWWGLDYSISNKKLNDSLDSNHKKISLFAGAHTSSAGHGGRAEIDLLRVRKWTPFGPSQANTPRVSLPPEDDSYLTPAYSLNPFDRSPWAH